MLDFEYLCPRSLPEALVVMAERAPRVRVLAGGTDLLVELRVAAEGPGTIVDIGRLRELRGIEETEGGLRIGSLTTHSETIGDRLVGRYAPVLAEAARSMASIAVRNRATLGGNLASAVPSLDGAPALLALDATVTIAGVSGLRRMPLSDFFLGPRRTALAPEELLTEIVLPRSMLGRPATFWKFGLRRGQALALVNTAASISGSSSGSLGARITLGAVAPTPIRARRAEEELLGASSWDEAVLAQVGEAAAAEASPIDDFRASAAFRRELIRVGVVRVLREVMARRARGGHG